MSTDDILRVAIECQLITTGNRDSFYAAALVRFANLVRTESLGEQPARVPLNDEQMDAVIDAAHHSLRQYKYSIRGQQITQFDSIEAHVIRETERAHDIKE